MSKKEGWEGDIAEGLEIKRKLKMGGGTANIEIGSGNSMIKLAEPTDEDRG